MTHENHPDHPSNDHDHASHPDRRDFLKLGALTGLSAAVCGAGLLGCAAPGQRLGLGPAPEQTFTGNAGQTVNFSFDFMTAGANLRLGNDFAFVMLDGTPHRLANTFSLLFPTDSASDFFRETRFQRASLTLVSSGPHTLAFGVVTVAQPNDTLGGSAVWIDNIVVRGVPEPSSVAVLLAGLVGVSVLIRTRVGH